MNKSTPWQAYEVGFINISINFLLL